MKCGAPRGEGTREVPHAVVRPAVAGVRRCVRHTVASPCAREADGGRLSTRLGPAAQAVGAQVDPVELGRSRATSRPRCRGSGRGRGPCGSRRRRTPSARSGRTSASAGSRRRSSTCPRRRRDADLLGEGALAGGRGALEDHPRRLVSKTVPVSTDVGLGVRETSCPPGGTDPVADRASADRGDGNGQARGLPRSARGRAAPRRARRSSPGRTAAPRGEEDLVGLVALEARRQLEEVGVSRPLAGPSGEPRLVGLLRSLLPVGLEQASSFAPTVRPAAPARGADRAVAVCLVAELSCRTRCRRRAWRRAPGRTAPPVRTG